MNKLAGKKKTSRFKKIASKLHLWLGLSVGFIIFFVSITGALYVFRDEIEALQRKDIIYHQERDYTSKKLLPIRVLEEKINEQVPQEYPIHWVSIPTDKSMSYRFYWYEHNPDGWHYFDEFPIYKLAYVNPYSGKVLALYDEKNGFFQIVKMLHWSFLLKESWGTYVVGIPVLLFIVMLFTGIILWWPKNKAARKQRFSFQWENVKNWKRKNYDVHNIFGFYSSILALIVAITGIFYAFIFVQTLMYFVFSGGQTALPDYSSYKTTAGESLRTTTTIDLMAEQTRAQFPQAFAFNIDLGHPHLEEELEENFQVYVQHLSYSYHQYSSIIFDENSAEVLKIIDYKDKNFGEKVVGANYDIHVGSILGLPTKIIAFIISLMIASMPVTGFLIWWGRRKKNKRSV